MASTLRSQVCEQERADQGRLMSEWIALGGSIPGGGSRSVHSGPLGRGVVDPFRCLVQARTRCGSVAAAAS